MKLCRWIAHTRPTKALSEGSKVRHLPTFVTSVKCHIHVFCVSLSPPERHALWRWGGGGDDFPRQALPFRRGHSAPLSKFFIAKKKTGLRARTPRKPSLPPIGVTRLCFFLACVKLQLYRCPAANVTLTDRHAKRTAKHLCSPQRSFLSYNWLFCPACGFGYKKNPLFQREPPSSPGKGGGGHRRTAEGAFQDGAAKVASSFKGPRMYTAHGSPGVCCEIARHLEEARREERTREQRREMRREEQQRGSCLDGVPGKRPAALSDFKCPSCEIAVSNANNLTACLRPTLPSTPSPFIPLSPSSYHEACRLGLPQKARRTKPSTTNFAFYLLDSNPARGGTNEDSFFRCLLPCGFLPGPNVKQFALTRQKATSLLLKLATRGKKKTKGLW